MRAAPVAIVILLALSGAAAAWPLEQHVTIQIGNTQIFIGADLDLVTLTFSGGAPVIDRVMLNLSSGSGYGNWTLTHYNPSETHFVLNGTLTQAGSIQISGPANNYLISGVGPLRVETGGSALRVFPLTSGTHEIVITAVPTVTQTVGRAVAENIGTVLTLVLAGVAMTILGAVFIATNRR